MGDIQGLHQRRHNRMNIIKKVIQKLTNEPIPQDQNHSHWVIEPRKQNASIWQYKPSDQTQNNLQWVARSAAISSQSSDSDSEATPSSESTNQHASVTLKRKLIFIALLTVGLLIPIFTIKHLRPPPELPTEATPSVVVQQEPLLSQEPHPPRISRYDHFIRTYADEHGFDWRLIAALIRQESNFNPYARSRSDARGLMQLIPQTAKEVGVRHVYNPKQNIAGGIRYLRKMYDHFAHIKTDDRLKFALASYNAGLGHILDAREIAGYHRHNHNDWDLVKKSLVKLTAEHTKIHQTIWGTQTPKHGYFDGAQETMVHVEKVLRYYKSYTTPRS